MCGLAGVLMPPGATVDPADLAAMSGALAHRGPDDEGTYRDQNVGFAHRRLAILDLSTAGHQPMANEDGTVQVVFNGQLYGFEPLREWLIGKGHRFRSRADTEVLVHLYEEKGDAMVEDIDGMFAFAVWDRKRRRLLLARDRLGIKPLHLVQDGGRLAFASELPALLRLPWVPREVSPLALVHYLYQSTVPGSTSLLRGHRKLGPGQLLVADAAGVRISTWWTLPPETDEQPKPFDRAADELRQRLQAAVRSHLVADVPVGTFLSGGLDSTAVTQQVVAAAAGPVHSFSVRFEGPRFDEGPAALEVARALGTVHHELMLDASCAAALPDLASRGGEPFAISSGLALHQLARFAREHVKVALTGDGADEILAGYPWRHEPERHPRALARGLAMTGVRSLRGARGVGPGMARQLRGRLGRMAAQGDARYAEIVHAFTPEEMTSLLDASNAPLAREAWENDPLRAAWRAAPGADAVNRRLRADVATSLVDEMLAKVDRMTMAVALEARVPFLDKALVEWAFRQPGRYKVRGGIGKRLLRHALAGSLPAAAKRPKHGFDVPLGAWLRGPLRERLLDVLGSTRLRQRGLLRPAAVDRLVSAHLAGRGDHSRKLFTLLVMEEWLARPDLVMPRAPLLAGSA